MDILVELTNGRTCFKGGGMSRLYGYCRISAEKKNIERQERNIRFEFSDAIIVRVKR